VTWCTVSVSTDTGGPSPNRTSLGEAMTADAHPYAGQARKQSGRSELTTRSAPDASAPGVEYRRRSHQVRETALSGALGGGLLGASFGPIGAATGMILGGLAGYLVERRLERSEQRSGA
jgi:hypothetical protein